MAGALRVTPPSSGPKPRPDKQRPRLPALCESPQQACCKCCVADRQKAQGAHPDRAGARGSQARRLALTEEVFVLFTQASKQVSKSQATQAVVPGKGEAVGRDQRTSPPPIGPACKAKQLQT